MPESQREPFYELISREDVPVKGILADFNKVKAVTVEEKDGDLISDIYFIFAKIKPEVILPAFYYQQMDYISSVPLFCI